MKKILTIAALCGMLWACSDNGNPSGTPSADSASGSLSVPDTSHSNNAPDMGATNSSTPNIADSATSSKPGRSGAGLPTTKDSSSHVH